MSRIFWRIRLGAAYKAVMLAATYSIRNYR
jgi:hypothetical protein